MTNNDPGTADGSFDAARDDGQDTVTGISAGSDRASAYNLYWWREVAYVVVFYGIYSLVRNKFGSASVDEQAAFDNALAIMDVQRSLGLFVEPTIQGWFVDATVFLKFWNVFYGSFHFLVTGGALIWLFWKFPQNYRFWRTALLCTTAFALVGFASYPLMPPRLLCDCPFGSGEDFGFVDTLKVHGGLWSFDSGPMSKISNQYAAMPSLHFGWALWSYLALRRCFATRWARMLLASYPWLTLFAIIVTANHYWLDAVGGAVVLAAGMALAALWVQALRRRDAARVPVGQQPADDQPAGI